MAVKSENHNDLSRRRAHEANRRKGALRPSETFDWDRAVRGLRRILAELDGRKP